MEHERVQKPNEFRARVGTLIDKYSPLLTKKHSRAGLGYRCVKYCWLIRDLIKAAFRSNENWQLLCTFYVKSNVIQVEMPRGFGSRL